MWPRLHLGEGSGVWPRMTEGKGDGAALGSQERLQPQERKRGDAGAQMPPRSRDCTSWSPRREVPMRKLLL